MFYVVRWMYRNSTIFHTMSFDESDDAEGFFSELAYDRRIELLDLATGAKLEVSD